MTTVSELCQRLEQAGFQITEPAASSLKQIKLFGRVANPRANFWARVVVRDLLRASGASEWALDASKQMVLVKGETYYRWRLIFQDNMDISRHLEEIVNVVSLAVTPDNQRMGREVVEMPLVGSSSSRNSPTAGPGKGKGASFSTGNN